MGLSECYRGCECFGAKPGLDGVLAYMPSCATPRPTYRLPEEVQSQAIMLTATLDSEASECFLETVQTGEHRIS